VLRDAGCTNEQIVEQIDLLQVLRDAGCTDEQIVEQLELVREELETKADLETLREAYERDGDFAHAAEALILCVDVPEWIRTAAIKILGKRGRKRIRNRMLAEEVLDTAIEQKWTVERATGELESDGYGGFSRSTFWRAFSNCRSPAFLRRLARVYKQIRSNPGSNEPEQLREAVQDLLRDRAK
jgi:hypothetical protein